MVDKRSKCSDVREKLVTEQPPNRIVMAVDGEWIVVKRSY